MKAEHILDAIGTINDEAIQDARTCQRAGFGGRVKWGILAACLCCLAATLVVSLGILKEPAASEDEGQPGTGLTWSVAADEIPRPVDPGIVQAGDDRAKTWLTAEELGIAKPQGMMGGLFVPAFLSYRGGFYGCVDTDEMDGLRFAPSEGEDLLFYDASHASVVYLVEDHPDWIAVHVNGMEVYEKIFDVTFTAEETTYAIAHSAAVDADYGLGGVVLETEDYTVYEAVRLREGSAQTKEYIVDILPILRRERPNFFGGPAADSGGNYVERWQLALPLE